MKTRTHHLVAIGIAVIVVALLAILPRGSQPSSSTQTSGLDGTWYTQWVGDEGEVTWMQYDILTPNYTVTASQGYREEGTYVLVKGAIDGSMVIEKTWTNALGEQTYELTIVPNEDFTSITFDGVTLTKIDK